MWAWRIRLPSLGGPAESDPWRRFLKIGAAGPNFMSIANNGKTRNTNKEVIVPRSIHEPLHFVAATSRPMLEPEVRRALLAKIVARERPGDTNPGQLRGSAAPS